MLSKFYIVPAMPLKVAWPHWPVGQAPLWWRVASNVTMAAVGLTAKFYMDFLNSKTVHNIETLHKLVDQRPSHQPLVTFCNHHSCLDEPLLWSILAWRHFTWAVHKIRWTTGAADICFNKEWHSRFFSLGRTIPLVRGDGVHQQSVDFAIQQLNAGKWVHIYPEGKVTRDDIRLKWGVGRMISEAATPPTVLGFYHIGMDHVLPNTRPYRPHTGKKVTVLVGEPMDLRGVLSGVKGVVDRRRLVTDCLKEELKRLERLTWPLHGEAPDYDILDPEVRLEDEDKARVREPLRRAEGNRRQ